MVDFEKISKYVAVTGVSVIASSIIYFGSLVGLQYYAERNSQRIKDMSELEQVLEAEKQKLGIENRVYPFISDSKFEADHWAKNPEGTLYTITLTTRHMNVAGLRHELKHIADGQKDIKPPNFFVHYFWREPRAILYAAFGK